MARKVSERPALPSPPRDARGIFGWATSLLRALYSVFQEHGQRINSNLPLDGDSAMEAPLALQQLAIADLPSASDWEGALVYVTDDTGGATPAYSDGTDWRRLRDDAVVTT